MNKKFCKCIVMYFLILINFSRSDQGAAKITLKRFSFELQLEVIYFEICFDIELLTNFFQIKFSYNILKKM